MRQLVAEVYISGKVASQTGPRVTTAMKQGLVPPAASSILKLLNSENGIRRSDVTMDHRGYAGSRLGARRHPLADARASASSVARPARS